jgi:FlaA1/EpsC-like NDP-sugar epimerase
LQLKKSKENDVKATKFITTRFGNVWVLMALWCHCLAKQIASGPITITHPDIMGTYDHSEACQLVLEAGAMGNGGEIIF